MIVACVLRSGGIYTRDWVDHLRSGVERHLKRKHQFICLSDVPCVGRADLVHRWPGWWSKIELFRIKGPVLYIDLDTIITGDLEDVASAVEKTDRLIMLRDFYRSDTHRGSGVMGWNGDLSVLYETFRRIADPFMDQYRLGGDQDFIRDTYGIASIACWQDLLPGQFVSYKAHVRQRRKSNESGNGVVPQRARMVCFHGAPKPSEMGWQLHVASDQPQSAGDVPAHA